MFSETLQFCVYRDSIWIFDFWGSFHFYVYWDSFEFMFSETLFNFMFTEARFEFMFSETLFNSMFTETHLNLCFPRLFSILCFLRLFSILSLLVLCHLGIHRLKRLENFQRNRVVFHNTTPSDSLLTEKFLECVSFTPLHLAENYNCIDYPFV